VKPLFKKIASWDGTVFSKKVENDCYEREKNEKQISGKTSGRISKIGKSIAHLKAATFLAEELFSL